MTLGMLGYVVNDAFVKKTVEDLELFQTIFIRGRSGTINHPKSVNHAFDDTWRLITWTQSACLPRPSPWNRTFIAVDSNRNTA